MKKSNLIQKKWQALVLMLLYITGTIQGQEVQTPVPDETKKHYLGTSVFVLSSLIPNDDTYFFELDYGYKLNPKNDLIVGANIYQYATPMSAPWKDAISYPIPILSYGVVLAWQHYLYRKLFINQMVNPLILDYNNGSHAGQKGFMLLMATRTGYHFDFKLFQLPVYFETGIEISYWPVNMNVPAEFDAVDLKYKRYVFSPALQFGITF